MTIWCFHNAHNILKNIMFAVGMHYTGKKMTRYIMAILITLIVSILIICRMALYIRCIQRLMKKKDEEFRIKEAGLLKHADEQAQKITVLKSLVDGQDKILAMYREQKK
ncbi:hypothetical protein [Ohtaekwangia sp.]|uniref:hypothetical protein n=1 Tax=Ohtaekwangia sp. TaxID=2066019 RepID=UPI002F93E9E2